MPSLTGRRRFLLFVASYKTRLKVHIHMDSEKCIFAFSQHKHTSSPHILFLLSLNACVRSIDMWAANGLRPPPHTKCCLSKCACILYILFAIHHPTHTAQRCTLCALERRLGEQKGGRGNIPPHGGRWKLKMRIRTPAQVSTAKCKLHIYAQQKRGNMAGSIYVDAYANRIDLFQKKCEIFATS